jgi:glycosyltransferase involved in cell wall biosynthesis
MGDALALRDVIHALGTRGWQVDTQVWAAGPAGTAPTASDPAQPDRPIQSKVSDLLGHPLLFSMWTRAVPLWLRRFLSTAAKPATYFKRFSDDLRQAEELFAEAPKYDVVLLYLEESPPGLGALLADHFERVVIISGFSLVYELRGRWSQWGRMIARWRLGKQMHPYLFRALASAKVQLALFVSAPWKKAALRAGLPEAKARTIYFGVPLPEPLPRSSETHSRILWAGRLTYEKGLHLILRALPMIRRQRPDATLTVIAQAGPRGYDRLIKGLIKKFQLEAMVTFVPPVERRALQEAYATHDVLFFHSIFADPVGLVLMEAFAAGLPVVASRASSEARLVQDQVTCLCYRPGPPESLSDAIVTLLTDDAVRRRVTTNARKLVQDEFSLDKLGQRYDEALSEFINGNSYEHAGTSAAHLRGTVARR